MKIATTLDVSDVSKFYSPVHYVEKPLNQATSHCLVVNIVKVMSGNAAFGNTQFATKKNFLIISIMFTTIQSSMAW